MELFDSPFAAFVAWWWGGVVFHMALHFSMFYTGQGKEWGRHLKG